MIKWTKIYYYYYYYYCCCCSKDLSMTMPCVGHEHFVAVLGWNLGIVSVQVILPTGHKDEIGERYIKSLTKTDKVPFGDRSQVRRLVDTYEFILREDVNRGGSARRLCLIAPRWLDLAACVLLFASL